MSRIHMVGGSAVLFLILSFFYPTIYLLKLNCYAFSSSQIITTILFVFLVSTVTAGVVVLIAHYSIKIVSIAVVKYSSISDQAALATKLFRALIGCLGSVVFLVLLHPEMSKLFPTSSNLAIISIYSAISAVISLVASTIGFKLINVTLVLWLMINCTLPVQRLHTPSKKIIGWVMVVRSAIEQC